MEYGEVRGVGTSLFGCFLISSALARAALAFWAVSAYVRTGTAELASLSILAILAARPGGGFVGHADSLFAVTDGGFRHVSASSHQRWMVGFLILRLW